MKIDVRDSAEFHRLLEALVDELIDAREHFNVHQGLAQAFAKYVAEYYQAGAFWSLTMTAHMDAALMRLCKAYDLYTGKPSLNLRNFLETIEANLHFFDEMNFRERLNGYPFVDSLAQDCRRPDSIRLKQDLESVTDANPLVKKLAIWRNNYFAHRSKTSALDLQAFTKQNPFSFPDIEALIANGIRILNDYSNLFSATVYTGYPADDYKYLLDVVRRDLGAREARIKEELAAANAQHDKSGS